MFAIWSHYDKNNTASSGDNHSLGGQSSHFFWQDKKILNRKFIFILKIYTFIIFSHGSDPENHEQKRENIFMLYCELLNKCEKTFHRASPKYLSACLEVQETQGTSSHTFNNSDKILLSLMQPHMEKSFPLQPSDHFLSWRRQWVPAWK